MARPSLINNTEWQEPIERMIASGWSSESVSEYMRFRYGHDLAASTVRRHAGRFGKRIRETYPDLVAEDQARTYFVAHAKADDFVDVLGQLGELIHMQRARLEIDLSIEKNDFNKLLPDTRHEIKQLSDLLVTYQSIAQDWGVVPKAGIDVYMTHAAAQLVPEEEVIEAKWTEALSPDDKQKIIDFTRLAHDQRALGNGEVD